METVAFGPLIRALDYLGVATFAVSGSLAAGRKELDPVGFAVVATATGIGGGTLRDLLLGRSPVFWIQQPVYLLICVGAAVLTFLLGRRVASRGRLLLWADAVGLAVFTLIGTEIALKQGVAPPVSVAMGAGFAVTLGVRGWAIVRGLRLPTTRI